MSATLDDMHSRGRVAVTTGTVEWQAVPEDGGRWGLSILLLPSRRLAEQLDALVDEAMDVAGHWHWPTGARGGGHVTVRALETYRSPAERDVGREAQYAAHIERAVEGVVPIRVRFDGLCLSPGAILLRATDVEGTGGLLRRRLAHAVPGDVETRWSRAPVWYLSLVHFASDIADGGRLVRWVEHSRPRLDTAIFSEVHLCRFEFDGRRAVPSSLAVMPLRG